VVEINSDAEDQLLVEALQEYEDSKFGADTTRTSFITVPEPEQVKIMICMQLQGSISSMNVMQTEIEIFKAELASHDNLWLSQSTTASIAVVEELSSEDAAEFEERVTTRKAKRAKQLLESASKVPTSLSSARRLIHVPRKLNL
jgi:Skp family chaperone for outer membrane proteins